MAKYRKKPVEIEAFQLGVDAPHHWWKEAVDSGRVIVDGKIAFIETLEGTHRANAGDYVIRGIAGELYPCRSDIFEATYERTDA